MRAFAAALFLIASASAGAADDVDCNDAMTQLDMNQCAQMAFETADKELNAVWKDARSAAKNVDDLQEDDLKGADEALVAAQRGWIAYRDGSCKVAGFYARGGSMEPMLMWSCMADLTRKRTAELKEFIDGTAE